MTAAITIHYRRPELTARCVDSLLADGWAPVLVWDNSADDGASIESLRLKCAGDARVMFAGSGTNLGFGRGMNAALARLGRRGPDHPVLLINNDARARPGMREALLQAAAQAAAPALIAPSLDQGGRSCGWLYYQPWLALVTRRRLPGSFRYLSGCCLLVVRADNGSPLFDPDFFMYGEDVELCRRWQRNAGQLVLLEQAWVAHAGSASSGPASASYEFNLVRSHWLLAGKLGRHRMTRAIMRLLRLPMLLARAVLRAWRFHSLMPVRALSALFVFEHRSGD